jgi:hypothetical protein
LRLRQTETEMIIAKRKAKAMKKVVEVLNKEKETR